MNFEAIFASDQSQQFKLAPADDAGKRKPINHRGNAGPPTPAMFKDHIEGKLALEVLPRNFGVIDVDAKDYRSFNAASWCKRNRDVIRAAKLIPTKSKSGGVRLWRIMAERVSPDLIAADLKYWKAQLIAGDNVKEMEIFPDGDRKVMLPFFGDACGMIEL